MTDITYTQNELESTIDSVNRSVNTDELPAHTWARCAKVLCAALEAAQAEVERLSRTMIVIDNDNK